MFQPRSSGAQAVSQVVSSPAPVAASVPTQPDVVFHPGFLPAVEADALLLVLLRDLTFRAETYTIQDRTIETKRKMRYMSEHAYTYSGQTYPGEAWHPALLELKHRIEVTTGHTFNAVLCNHYENGEAGMGWHADKEAELGPAPVIASLSLGQARTFAFRHRRDVVNLANPPRLIDYRLASGDLLLMQGDTQRYFEHSLLKQSAAKAPGPRINLTFRRVFGEEVGRRGRGTQVGIHEGVGPY